MTDTEAAAMIYEGLTDAELVLVALALNSGACVASTPMTAGLAGKANDLLFETMAKELQRREINTSGMAGRLMERVALRAIDVVTARAAAPSPPAADAPPPADPPGASAAPPSA